MHDEICHVSDQIRCQTKIQQHEEDVEDDLPAVLRMEVSITDGGQSGGWPVYCSNISTPQSCFQEIRFHISDPRPAGNRIPLCQKIEEASGSMNHQKSYADELQATDPEIAVVSIFLQSGKQSTDPTQTPESEHVKESIVIYVSRKYEAVEFRGDRGNYVKNKPRSYIFPSDLLMIVDEKVCCFVVISHEESQRDIYGEETIDYIIGNSQTSDDLLQETEFK